jgi:16S rRNA G527 N7-methylase RsmG
VAATTPDLSTQRAWTSRLDAGAGEIGIDLDESQLTILWQYAQMMRERNQHVNLTSITSPEGILTRPASR